VIRHLVLFNLKPDLNESEREWLFGQIRGIAKVPSVRRMSFGRLLEPREDWYRPRMSADFDWAVTMEFGDEAGLYAYQADPYHMTVAQEIRKRVTLIRVSDFVSI